MIRYAHNAKVHYVNMFVSIVFINDLSSLSGQLDFLQSDILIRLIYQQQHIVLLQKCPVLYLVREQYKSIFRNLAYVLI